MATPGPGASALIGDTRLYAHDLITGTRLVHDSGPRRHPGEFVFVPESANAPEGHGWLVGLVVDINTETTEFVILDARDFVEAPVATVHLPHRVPPGFHGNWIG